MRSTNSLDSILFSMFIGYCAGMFLGLFLTFNIHDNYFMTVLDKLVVGKNLLFSIGFNEYVSLLLSSSFTAAFVGMIIGGLKASMPSAERS